MSTLVIELEDDLFARLESIGPREPGQRSELISRAIRNALWELEERRTAAAYARQPDTSDDAYLDPDSWEPRSSQ